MSLRRRQLNWYNGISWSSLPQPTVDSTFSLETFLECHPTALTAPDLALCQAWFAQSYIQLPPVRWQWRINVVTLTTAGPGGCRRRSIKDGMQRYDSTLVGDDLPLFYSDANRGMVAAKDFVLINELSAHPQHKQRCELIVSTFLSLSLTSHPLCCVLFCSYHSGVRLFRFSNSSVETVMGGPNRPLDSVVGPRTSTRTSACRFVVCLCDAHPFLRCVLCV